MRPGPDAGIPVGRLGPKTEDEHDGLFVQIHYIANLNRYLFSDAAYDEPIGFKF
jgi:hypothetical protein